MHLAGFIIKTQLFPPRETSLVLISILAGICRAAQSETMKSTFVVDKQDQKRARLSWYHPDDTVSLLLKLCAREDMMVV